MALGSVWVVAFLTLPLLGLLYRAGSTGGLLEAMGRADVPAKEIGRVGPPRGRVRIAAGDAVVDAPAAELAEIYFGAIPRRMDGTPEEVDAALHSEVGQR